MLLRCACSSAWRIFRIADPMISHLGMQLIKYQRLMSMTCNKEKSGYPGFFRMSDFDVVMVVEGAW